MSDDQADEVHDQGDDPGRGPLDEDTLPPWRGAGTAGGDPEAPDDEVTQG